MHAVAKGSKNSWRAALYKEKIRVSKIKNTYRPQLNFLSNFQECGDYISPKPTKKLGRLTRTGYIAMFSISVFM